MTQVKLGDENIPFIYQGDELLYPNPVKDGLVLWYDFKGIKNDDFNKGIAEDLSGNKNNGTLQNFAYTNDSGYNDGLKFDGVDDYVIFNLTPSFRNTTYELIINREEQMDDKVYQVIMQPSSYWVDGIFISNNNIRASVRIDGTYYSVEYPMTDYLNKNILITRILDSDNKVLKIFINGVKVREKTFTTDVYEKINERYYLNSPGKDGFLGNINSLKVYKKPLSDQEVQHNYKLEKERWGL
ncbi:LamG-like jellyroll fold domain-containing protein [Staphylococcus hominis]|uniref:LamG-like jellyroll fold domain-containing protein n=1 Tax=Staphylococcus hominis TaxID=1290 RepID=UPI00321C268C